MENAAYQCAEARCRQRYPLSHTCHRASRVGSALASKWPVWKNFMNDGIACANVKSVARARRGQHRCGAQQRSCCDPRHRGCQHLNEKFAACPVGSACGLRAGKTTSYVAPFISLLAVAPFLRRKCERACCAHSTRVCLKGRPAGNVRVGWLFGFQCRCFRQGQKMNRILQCNCTRHLIGSANHELCS